MKLKRTLVMFVLLAVLLFALSSTAAALHMPDTTGRTCFRCHSAHEGVNSLLLNGSISGLEVPGYVGGYDKDASSNANIANIDTSTMCLACHDGTGSRSVTWDGSTNAMHSGVFDISLNNKPDPDVAVNKSSHSVFISASAQSMIAAAPGNKNEDYYSMGPRGWSNKLSCTSCHNPHGTMSEQHAHLQLNPNATLFGHFGGDYGTGWTDKEYTQVTLTKIAPGLYEEQANENGVAWLRHTRSSGVLRYPVAVQQGETWLFNVDIADGSKNFDVNSTKGQIQFADDSGPATYTARVFKPILVDVVDEFDGTIYEEDGETIRTISDVRVYNNDSNTAGLSRWCGACHGNYNISSRTGQPFLVDGVEHFGHNVHRSWPETYATPKTVGGSMNCFSCHFAHGTNSELMVDSEKAIVGGRTEMNRYGDEVRLVDSNPANKRYIGGAVCMRCHYSSHGDLFMYNNQERPTDWQWY